jgi:hypothetical protein
VIGIAAGGISTNWFGSQRANQERLASRTAIQRSTTTDSDPLRYRAPLQPIVQAYGVGGTQPGVGKLLVLWSLPATDRPRADTVPGVTGIVYSIRVRANVFDTLGNLVVGIDSVRRYRAPALLQPGTSLPGLLQIEVPAGIYRIQLSVADTIGDKGAARVLGGIPVPSFTGPFELSDLVLGIEGNGPFWVRNPTSRFPLNPRNAWTNTESMEVGFELAGLPAGTAYKTRIAVADLGADSTRPPRASVEFDNQAKVELLSAGGGFYVRSSQKFFRSIGYEMPAQKWISMDSPAECFGGVFRNLDIDGMFKFSGKLSKEDTAIGEEEALLVSDAHESFAAGDAPSDLPG